MKEILKNYFQQKLKNGVIVVSRVDNTKFSKEEEEHFWKKKKQMDYRELAYKYRDIGMVVIPVDGNKQPKNVSWHFFQDR